MHPNPTLLKSNHVFSKQLSSTSKKGAGDSGGSASITNSNQIIASAAAAAAASIAQGSSQVSDKVQSNSVTRTVISSGSRGPWGPAPFAPQEFFKITQLSGN